MAIILIVDSPTKLAQNSHIKDWILEVLLIKTMEGIKAMSFDAIFFLLVINCYSQFTVNENFNIKNY